MAYQFVGGGADDASYTIGSAPDRYLTFTNGASIATPIYNSGGLLFAGTVDNINAYIASNGGTSITEADRVLLSLTM
jgi:hypothetical protein